MKRKLRSLVIITLLFISNTGQAQETPDNSKIQLNIGTDIVSRYIWRGQQFGGNSPSIQPFASVSYNNLEFGFWGAYSLSGSNTGQELDSYLSYSFAKDIFTTTITNYFFPDNQANYNYFDYSAANTGHILEASLSFNGTEKIPLSFLAAVNFFGADAAKIESNPASSKFNTKTGIQYSNYFELGYTHTFNSIDFNAFLGFTLSNPKAANISTGYIGESGFYGNKAGIVNTGFSLSKKLQISKNFALPISASIITNPETKKIFMTLKFSF